MNGAERLDAPAVAFDVGGVLYHDEPFEVSWLQEVWNLVRQDTTWSHFGRAAARYFAMKKAGRPDIGLFTPAGTHAWSKVRANWIDLAQPVDGMLELVEALAVDHPILIVANQPPETADLIEQEGIPVDVVALDSVVGYSKPDPRLLAWAIHRAGIASSDTIVVGDSVLNDERPALTLGCKSVLYTALSPWTTPAGVAPAVDDLYRRLKTPTATQSGRAPLAVTPDEVKAQIDAIDDRRTITTIGGLQCSTSQISR